jgi:hypothetical protein
MYPHVDVAKTSGAVTVNTTTTALLAANPSRVELTIVNLDGTNPVYLVLSTVAGVAPTATTNGLKLPAGGSWTTTSYTGAVAAIATTAACSVNVTEL